MAYQFLFLFLRMLHSKEVQFSVLLLLVSYWLKRFMFLFLQVVGLHGGALLGVTYRTSRRISPLTATAISTVQSMPLSGFGGSGSSFASDDPFSSREGPPQNLQLYRYIRTQVFHPFCISRKFIIGECEMILCYALLLVLTQLTFLFPIPMIFAANVCVTLKLPT